MRHADIEEEIVERGVHQRKHKDETPVYLFTRFKRTPTATGNRQDYQTCRCKADASKEHLAACHICRNAKSTEADLDERECPTPSYCSGQGKDNDPWRSLKYGYPRLFHLKIRIRETSVLGLFLLALS